MHSLTRRPWPASAILALLASTGIITPFRGQYNDLRHKADRNLQANPWPGLGQAAQPGMQPDPRLFFYERCSRR